MGTARRADRAHDEPAKARAPTGAWRSRAWTSEQPSLASASGRAAAKPAGERESFAPGGKNLVLKALAQEGNERAARGEHVERLTVAQVHTQRAPVGRPPRIVEIDDARNDTRIVVAKTVAMTRVTRARWIQRVMHLELLESEVKRG